MPISEEDDDYIEHIADDAFWESFKTKAEPAAKKTVKVKAEDKLGRLSKADKKAMQENYRDAAASMRDGQGTLHLGLKSKK